MVLDCNHSRVHVRRLHINLGILEEIDGRFMTRSMLLLLRWVLLLVAMVGLLRLVLLLLG